MLKSKTRMSQYIPYSANEKHIDVISIYDDTVFCSGEDTLGHPGVFLDLSKTGRAVCPYCSQIFENIKRLGQEKS
ncbi:MAG: zinc-finger domain-containing protein [Holosporaceae bacterium]